MAAINQNFIKYRGDEYYIVFALEDTLDLTGYQAHWSLAVNADEAKLVEKDSDPPDVHGGVTFVHNRVIVRINKADTISLNPETYYHELQLLDPNGEGGVAASGYYELREPLHKRDE